MDASKILSVLGLGCVLLLLIPICMLVFMVLVGTATWVSDPNLWTSEDSSFLIGFAISLLCLLGIALPIGGISVYGLFRKNQ